MKGGFSELRVEMRSEFVRVTTKKEVENQIAELATMTKNGFTAVDERFDEVDNRLDKIDDRLDRIENILIAGHDRRIEKLEDTMRQLVLAVKLKIN